MDYNLLPTCILAFHIAGTWILGLVDAFSLSQPHHQCIYGEILAFQPVADTTAQRTTATAKADESSRIPCTQWSSLMACAHIDQLYGFQ